MAPLLPGYTELVAPFNSIQPHNSARNHLHNPETFTLNRPKWQQQPACLGYIAQGMDYWFPDKGESGNNSKTALTICETCPVKTECLADAILQGPYCEGTWGGLTKQERKKLRIKNAKPGPATYWNHGTTYGYDKHKCRCPQCVDAHTRAQARYRRKRAAA
jgi:hypothetical protein